MDNSVKFVQFQSVVDQSFWHKLCQLKLEVDKLEETQRQVWGSFLQPDVCLVFVDSSSFNRDCEWKLSSGEHTTLRGLCSSQSKCNFPLVSMPGLVTNFNTLEGFKNEDKNRVLSECGHRIRRLIASGEALDKPNLLNSFILLTFCDLKKYDFYYWFSFPATISVQASYVGDQTKLKDLLGESQVEDFLKSHELLSKENKIAFGLRLEGGRMECITVKDLVTLLNSGPDEQLYLCFLDPSTTLKYPGWPLRNLLALISYHWKNAEGKALKIISFRIGPTFLDSPVFQVSMSVDDREMTKWVGWEKNSRDKLGPRFTSLKDSMDPVRLADSSAKLNLKLMKWRLAPQLNLDIISEQRVLILGAGTLGCALARNLLCWGVRKITFVDNGRVSYSNPVRQCLYNLSDCLQPKAPAAALALKAILPTVEARGETLEIPMPGHSTASLDEAMRLHDLVLGHDTVFLVTDSRESRWLPTLLAASLGKLAITAALGFDSYLVIRHGSRTGGGDSEEAGCYFCNDVTAPGDSSADRTLDQQCTVSRPGVSSMAAALAAELYVSVLQGTTKVVTKDAVEGRSGSSSAGLTKEEEECVLGAVPHSIRGFLSSYSHIMPRTAAFSQCIACSPPILRLYATDSQGFLTDVFQSNAYLEQVTGLSDLHRLTQDIQDLSLSEEESGLDD